MAPRALVVYDNSLAHESDVDACHEFDVFPGENPNFLMKKECSQGEKQISVDPVSLRSLSESSSMRIDSFNIMLPPAMSPPRDSTVPLPPAPQPVKIKKKLSKQESLLFLKKHSYSFDHYEKKQPESFFSKPEMYKTDKGLKSFDSYENEFKCNPFCMFLPSFGKAKPVRAAKRDDSMEKKTMRSSFTNTAISTRVSFEKFECGSWASSALAHDERGLDSMNFLFDLPVEMVRSSGELHRPVSSGFLFDKDVVALKGVLKTSSSKSSRRSAESSPRRVRFSTSSSMSCPTSPRSQITPRLRKAREDFNAFLEAQNG